MFEPAVAHDPRWLPQFGRSIWDVARVVPHPQAQRATRPAIPGREPGCGAASCGHSSGPCSCKGTGKRCSCQKAQHPFASASANCTCGSASSGIGHPACLRRMGGVRLERMPASANRSGRHPSDGSVLSVLAAGSRHSRIRRAEFPSPGSSVARTHRTRQFGGGFGALASGPGTSGAAVRSLDTGGCHPTFRLRTESAKKACTSPPLDPACVAPCKYMLDACCPDNADGTLSVQQQNFCQVAGENLVACNDAWKRMRQSTQYWHCVGPECSNAACKNCCQEYAGTCALTAAAVCATFPALFFPCMARAGLMCSISAAACYKACSMFCRRP